MSATVTVQISGTLYEVPLIESTSTDALSGFQIRDIGSGEIVRGNPQLFAQAVSAAHAVSLFVEHGDEVAGVVAAADQQIEDIGDTLGFLSAAVSSSLEIAASALAGGFSNVLAVAASAGPAGAVAVLASTPVVIAAALPGVISGFVAEGANEAVEAQTRALKLAVLTAAQEFLSEASDLFGQADQVRTLAEDGDGVFDAVRLSTAALLFDEGLLNLRIAQAFVNSVEPDLADPFGFIASTASSEILSSLDPTDAVGLGLAVLDTLTEIEEFRDVQNTVAGFQDFVRDILESHVFAPFASDELARLNDIWADQAVTGSSGNDVITGGLTGEGVPDDLRGLGGNDTLNAGQDGGFLDGGAGDDLLVVGDGDHTLVGGTGDDRFDLSGGSSGTTFILDDGGVIAFGSLDISDVGFTREGRSLVIAATGQDVHVGDFFLTDESRADTGSADLAGWAFQFNGNAFANTQIRDRVPADLFLRSNQSDGVDAQQDVGGSGGRPRVTLVENDPGALAPGQEIDVEDLFRIEGGSLDLFDAFLLVDQSTGGNTGFFVDDRGQPLADGDGLTIVFTTAGQDKVEDAILNNPNGSAVREFFEDAFAEKDEDLDQTRFRVGTGTDDLEIVPLVFNDPSDSQIFDFYDLNEARLEFRIHSTVPENRAPSLSVASASMSVGGPLQTSFSVSDPDGDQVTLRLSLTGDGSFRVAGTAPANDRQITVSASDLADGRVSIDGVGKDDNVQLQVVAVDGFGATTTRNINVDVQNSVPTARDDAVTAFSGQETILDAADLLRNDSDIDEADQLQVTQVGSATHGSVSLQQGQVVYQADPDFEGADSFAYTVSDQDGGTDTATVTVTVTTLTISPDAVDDVASVDEDRSVLIDVLANDTVDEPAVLSILSASQGSSGVVAIENGDIRYTPDADFSGADSFTYTVSDGTGGTDTATVRVSVAPVNDGPVARDDTVVVNEDQSVLVDVLSNDTDVEGDSLVIVQAGTPANGIATIENGQIRYTPAPDFVGTDQFDYTISDGDLTATATVVVTVEQADNHLVGDSGANALAGGVGQDTLDGLGGDDTLNGGTGDDVIDGGAGDDLAVFAGNAGDYRLRSVGDLIQVRGPDGVDLLRNVERLVFDDGERSPDDEIFRLDREIPVNSQVGGNQDNPIVLSLAGGGFVVAWDSGEGNITQSGTQIFFQLFDAIGNPVGGETLVVESSDSVWMLTGAPRADGGFTLGWGQNSSTDILFRSFDSQGGAQGSGPAVATVNTAGLERVPGIAATQDGGFAIVWRDSNSSTDIKLRIFDDQDNPVTADIDVDAGPDNAGSCEVVQLANGNLAVTYLSGSGPAILVRLFDSAGVALTTSFAVSEDGVRNVEPTLTALSDGGFMVVWSAEQSPDVILGQRLDGDGNPVGDRFQVHADLAGRQERPNLIEMQDGNILVTWTETGGDAEASDIRAQIIQADGTRVGDSFFLNLVTTGDQKGANGDLDSQQLAVLENGDVVAVWDSSRGDSNGLGIVARIIPAADLGLDTAPLAVADTAITDEDNPVLIDVLANDLDIDGDALTPAVGQAPAHGTATVENGQIRYTPDPDFAGDDLFSYVVSDGDLTDTATVSVTVNPVNDAPDDVALSALEVAEDASNGTEVGILSATDPDDGDQVILSLVGDAGGRFALDGDRLVVADGDLIDFETATSHTVTVRATDGAGAILDRNFVLSVIDVPENVSSLDLDGNGTVDALTDGLIALGGMFGAPATQLAALAAPGSPGTDAQTLATTLAAARTDWFDVDGNGAVDALTDGLLVLGHLFGAPDSQLDPFIADGATRTTGADIGAFLDQLLPVDTA